MALSSEEISAWAQDYIQAQISQDKFKPGFPFWVAIERFGHAIQGYIPNPDDPYKFVDAEDAWITIIEVLSLTPSDEVLSVLAAGPLEDLIAYCGPQFIDRIEIKARQDADFRKLLNGVWQNRTPPEIWARIEKAQNKK